MSLSEAPRHVRRQAYAQERSERSSGRWSPWHRVSDELIAWAYISADAEFGAVGGWVREVHTAWTNGWLSVSVRTIKETSLGIPVEHAFIRTAMCDELTWAEKQRVKNEIFGKDRMAIEVYPRVDDLVDAADIYHIWVFPAGYRFDFGLGTGQR